MGSFLSKQLKGDRIIWTILIVLMMVSALAMFSASSGLAYDQKFKGHFLAPISKHLMFLLVGLGVTYLVHLVPPKKIFLFGGFFGYLISIPLLVWVLVAGKSANEAARWISLPIIGNFQPSELAKLSVVLALCSAMGYYHSKGDVNKGFGKYIAIIALPSIFILPENLSTFLLLGIVSLILLFIGGVALKNIGKLLLGLFSILALVVAITLVESWVAPEKSGLKVEGVERKEGRTPLYVITHRTGTWISRVKEHFGGDLTPEEKKARKFEITGKKQQTGHAHIAVARGKWFGVGIGNSEERDFIPQSYADFIFAVIVEEIGVLSLFIILLYLALFYRSCVVLNRSESYNNSFAAVGLSCLIVVQSFMHIAVVLGMMPVTGQPLPIISRGGTSILTTCAYFGVILALSRGVTDGENAAKKSISRKPSETKVAKNDKESEEVETALNVDVKNV